MLPSNLMTGFTIGYLCQVATFQGCCLKSILTNITGWQGADANNLQMNLVNWEWVLASKLIRPSTTSSISACLGPYLMADTSERDKTSMSLVFDVGLFYIYPSENHCSETLQT